MGGGESSSSDKPYDLMGGQYASFSGGTPGYDYNGLAQGIGKGFQQFGSSMQNQSVPNYMTGASNIAQSNIPGALPQTNLIPITTGGGSDVMSALMRLLGGLS